MGFRRAGEPFAITLPSSGIFGSGFDGDAVFDGTSVVSGFAPAGGVYTFTNPRAFNNVHVASGVILDVSGMPVQINGTLTGPGTFRRNGNNAAGVNAGAAIANSLYLPGGGGGGNGGSNAAGSSPGSEAGAPDFYATAAANGGAPNGGNGTPGGACHGGGGGAGGSGSSGGTGGPITASARSKDYRYVNSLINARDVVGNLFGRTTGGGGGASAVFNGVNGVGGGGGGAAAWLYLAVRRSRFTGVLLAVGGNGANGVAGSGGGGGGGGGGVIVCPVGTGALPSYSVAGGTGGTGRTEQSSVGGNGGAGGDGVAFIWRLSERF